MDKFNREQFKLGLQDVALSAAYSLKASLSTDGTMQITLDLTD